MNRCRRQSCLLNQQKNQAVILLKEHEVNQDNKPGYKLCNLDVRGDPDDYPLCRNHYMRHNLLFRLDQ